MQLEHQVEGTCNQRDGAEALDAFMHGQAQLRTAADVKRLRHELLLTQEQIKQTEELIRIADPLNEHKSHRPPT